MKYLALIILSYGTLWFILAWLFPKGSIKVIS